MPRTRPNVIALATALGLSGSALAADLHVPADFPTPQAAINASDDGDVVILAPGTWPAINLAGKAITVRSEDPSDPAVVAATVIDAAGTGAAVLIFSGERRDTIIEGLTITGGSATFGGGIGILGADPWIRDCVIIGNEASNQGGGIYASQCSPLFERCRIEGNTASRGGGAATFLTNWARFEQCTIVDNVASTDGGGLFHSGYGYFVRINRCLIANNTAGALGGGVAFDNGPGDILGCVIRDNSAELGGGVSFFDIGGRIVNTTIVRNSTTSGQSGALFGFDVQPLIRNSIFRDNGPAPYDGFSVNLAVEYSNLEGGVPGVGNIDADPQFVNPGDDDFRLEPGSPSVDSGFNGWLPAYALDDFNDTPRIQNGTVDMGPFEVTGPVPELPEASGALVVVGKDNYNILYGLDSPILMYDVETEAWSEFARNVPAFSIAADEEEQCFWVHNGEAFTLGRIPYDTRRLEEIAVIKYNGELSAGIPGLAVRDGVLYGVTAIDFGIMPLGFFEIDKQTGVATLLHQLPDDFTAWDLHYDEPTDRMLILSSTETLGGGGPLGIFEIDIDTGAITEVQPWFNPNPFEEAGGLQGLAVGAGRNWILRSLENRIESWDSDALTLVDAFSLPGLYPASESGIGLGGLTWAPSFAPAPCPADLSLDGTVNSDDLFELLGSWGACDPCPADLTDDGAVNSDDLFELLGAWGPCPAQ